MKLFNKKKTISKGELRNVEVELVSLLFDEMTPANQKGFIVKSAQGRSYNHTASSVKFKTETKGTQGRVYVTLMEPDQKDSQGDYYTKDEIQKACDWFSKHGMVGKNDVNHNMHPVDKFSVVENYILKTADSEHFPDTKVGAWVQVLKCEDLTGDLWQKVIKGQFNGVSIYGKAEDFGDTQKTLEAIKNDLQNLKSLAENSHQSDNQTANLNLSEGIENLSKKISELENNSNDMAVKDAVKSIEKSIRELSQSMTKAISKSIQGEPEAGSVEADREIMIDGAKYVIKAKHKEIYKGIADVDSGKPMNILNPNTTSLFIDEVVGSQPGDTLSDITVVPLIKDEKIDAGLIDDLIFKNSLDGALTAQNVNTADITLSTGILNAEFTLGREVVEFYKNKYGEDAFGAYVEQHIARKTEKAMRILLFKGDRTSATAKLKALNGIIKMATDATDVTNLSKVTYDTWSERFDAALLSFTDDMLEEQENFVIYVSQKDLIRIRSELANRPTNLGDRLILEGGKVTYAGIPVKSRLMPDDYIIMGLSKFIIIGYRTDAELKVEHHGADWKYHWYIRIRPGITYVATFIKFFKLTAS